MPLHSPCLPEQRRPLLRALLREGRVLRAIECHNPLSAMLGSAASASIGGERATFDALWASGFAHACTLGLPDAELSVLERRIDVVSDIASATSLPIIADADTGGDELAFMYLCRRLEGLGVSAVIVEDKSGAKRTSLAESVHHQMENPNVFNARIYKAKVSMLSGDLLIFARIESLIAGLGLEDALLRARIYLRGSADGVVIHSKDKTAKEIFAFMEGYRDLQQRLGVNKPLVLIPTAYNHVTGEDLHKRGARLIIHGNHMIRAAYSAMREVSQSLLEHDRSLEADALCAPVGDLFDSVGVGSTGPESSRSSAGAEPASKSPMR